MTAGDFAHHPVAVGIALGSNEGDRLANLRAARERITILPGIAHGGLVNCVSAPVFETAPVDCLPGSAAFLNSVLEIPFHPERFPPAELLAELRNIESSLGRPTRHPRNSPRTVDLDILYFGDLQLTAPELTIPHPRLAQRRFVLAPLAAIRPDLVLPGQTRPVSTLLHELPAGQKVSLYATHW